MAEIIGIFKCIYPAERGETENGKDTKKIFLVVGNYCDILAVEAFFFLIIDLTLIRTDAQCL